jgi:hypothetical protein
MNNHLSRIATELLSVRESLSQDQVLKLDIDFSLGFLNPYSLANSIDDIKLVFVGQDPTIRNIESRGKINATLNLDKKNCLRSYLENVCKILKIDIDKEVYATNLYKCFFHSPPADDETILTRHFKVWVDLLKNELKPFNNPIIITLGEPLIKQLIHTGNKEVKYYWDYMGNTKTGKAFKAVPVDNNYLQRTLYPIAHQPAWSKNKFYREYLTDYLQFIICERKNCTKA